jgi:hypothetical protein
MRRFLERALLAVLFSFFCISTVAQTAHFAGAQSTVADNLNGPWGIAVDRVGAVYIADEGNFRVLKETPTVQGYVQSIFVQQATSGVSYFLPYGVATDASGDVFVLNGGDGQILKFSPTHHGYAEMIIPRPASVYGGPAGIAADVWGNIYLSFIHSSAETALKLSPTANGYVAKPIGSGLGVFSLGVAVDIYSTVYVAALTGDLYKETPSAGGYVQSVVASGFDDLYGVAADPWANLYVAAFEDPTVWKETRGTGGYTKSAVASTGFSNPIAVAVDALSDLYVSDNGKNRVTVLNGLGGFFPTVEVGSTSDAAIAMLFTFDQPGTLGSTSLVTLGGGAGAEFEDSGTGSCKPGADYTAGQSCWVDVNFAPRLTGAQWGAVQLRDSHGKVMATGYMTGIGTR